MLCKKTLLILTLLLAMSLPGVASFASHDSVFLWRGFTHEWSSRNHRIGRIGNWLSMSCTATSCTGNAHHAADVGSASDTADWRTAYTELTTNVAGLQPGYTNISINGSEGDVLTGTQHVTISAQTNMQSRDRYVAMLNGFDLEAQAGAKKLDRLKILLENLTYSNGDLELDVKWVLKVDCDSPECWFDSNTVDYDLQVRYVLVGGDLGGFRYTNGSLAHNYNWGTLTEIFSSSHEHADTINPITSVYDYEDGTVGIRGFNINLDDDFHLLETIVRVQSISYDAVNDTVDYIAETWFKQWINGMAIGAYKESGGTTRMEVWTTLLEFTSADIRGTSQDGTVSSANEHQEIPIAF